MKLNKSIIYKIFTLILLVSMTTFYACDEKTEVNPKAKLEFVEVAIPDVYKSVTNDRSSSGKVDDVIVDVQFTTNDGKEIVGKIHLVMPDDESLSYFAMTENIFSETGIESGFWVDNIGNATNGRLRASCIGSCQTAFTDKNGKKIKGRGACKAGCWVAIAAAVIGAIAAIK